MACTVYQLCLQATLSKKNHHHLSPHFIFTQPNLGLYSLISCASLQPCQKKNKKNCHHISHAIKPWLVQSGQICSLLFLFFFSHQGFLDKKPPVITVHFMYSGQYISLGFVHFRQLCGLFHHGLLVKRSTCHHSLFSIQLYRLRCRTSPTQRI